MKSHKNREKREEIEGRGGKGSEGGKRGERRMGSPPGTGRDPAPSCEVSSPDP